MFYIQARQGDVFFIRVDAQPKGTIIPRDENRVVVAYGEVTGHAHAFTEDWVEQLQTEANETYLVVKEKEANLVHEEHSTITFPPGVYRVVHQREYTSEGERRVQD